MCVTQLWPRYYTDSSALSAPVSLYFYSFFFQLLICNSRTLAPLARCQANLSLGLLKQLANKYTSRLLASNCYIEQLVFNANLIAKEMKFNQWKFKQL